MAAWRRASALAVALALAAMTMPAAVAQGPASPGEPGVSRGPVTGLPVPRYVSLKSDRVHVRQGPGLDYKVLWVFQRVGLPVEVIREFEVWREIRDAEGATGWVLQSLLSGRRTGLIVHTDAKRDATLSPKPRMAVRASARNDADAVAMVEPGVIANVLGCDGAWCRIAIGNVKGHVQQKQLWGVYDGEKVR